jgi:hypothetical protein
MTLPGTGGLIVKPWRVSVSGYGEHTYFAASRGKALAQAWRSGAFMNWSFKDFLQRARAVREEPMGRFGEYIEVGGKPAYLVSYDRQYIQFVRPDSDVILNSHPYDVEPPEARRGTAYYREIPA